MKELSKHYDPQENEGKIYKFWEKGGYFTPKIDKTKKPFTIMIPPPNVTGSLHMGHALNNTIQDILIRRARMKGIPALWLPGTDHAGIATQNVVEKKLVKEGKTRHDLGREKFLAEVWRWKDKYEARILGQLKTLGCSCDWSRTRFTMDKEYEEAVLDTFVHYYKKGYLYRGHRVINWCIRCQTALSDIELEHEEDEGFLWYFDYPIEGGGKITVATTRPETMLGDTGVAVNPKDKRYKDLIGKFVILPLVSRKIPIVADSAIDPKFGTGAVKVTPAHDALDFEIGERHNLPKIVVISPKGKMTSEAPEQYAGMSRHECRDAVVHDLEKLKLVSKIEEYRHNVGHCYRCNTVIEPLLSLQWFVKMNEMAKPAIEAVKKGKIKFSPKRWEKVYLEWMKNLKDWCVSRQIWWGHRLPVYYCQDQKNEKCKKDEGIIVSRETIQKCPCCGGKVKRDDDVLDTWFSSAIWPHATLGWPHKTKDLDYFYPTSVLVTARDIIYLWVARMIMTGLEFMGDIPFEWVHFNATVLNKEGRRMSKSLGTGVDPLDLIERYGADATRFGLIWQAAQGQDIKFGEEALLAGKKFVNKLWNASKFVMFNIDGKVKEYQVEELKLSASDRKILAKLEKTVKKVDLDIEKFDFQHALETIYHFFWHDFCDKTIEDAKERLNGEDKEANQAAQYVLYKVLTDSLKLLHPFTPFVTETIWESLGEEEALIISKWPGKQ